MENKKDDRYYLQKMLVYISYILQYIKTIYEQNNTLKTNDQNSDGVIYKFIQLIEESSKLSSEFLKKNYEICRHVKLLNGFRNRLTHDYENVSYSFFEEIINIDLPKLHQLIEEILVKTI